MRIVILGGGTAGWIAASLFAKRWAQHNVQVTLVESENIGIIGVGEGSTPTLKRFFEDMDIPEAEWMPACNATYKVNIRFADWSPASGIASYSHPFISQLDTFSERSFYLNCNNRRLGYDVETRPEKLLFNGWLAAQDLAPVTPENFPFRIEYGYHFDSALLGQFLAQRSAKLGVEHIQDDVLSVTQHANGDIAALTCASGRVIEGDFFVDSTGFKSQLLQQTLGVKFKSFKDNLFNDRAVVLPTDALAHMPVETRATALSNGWVWQIPLTHRTGNGYVFSSDFITTDAAETELRLHLGLENSDLEARHLQMQVGQVEQHWANNCLALGLSQGFIEPLEATAIHLVQTGVEIFMDCYEQGQFTAQHRDEFNHLIAERFERVRDYIVAHYKLNTRDDSEYWRANRENKVLSEPLIHILNTWFAKQDLVAKLNELDAASHFNATSWHCLFAGYGAFPELLAEQRDDVCHYQENKLAKLFAGSALNFQRQVELYQTRK